MKTLKLLFHKLRFKVHILLIECFVITVTNKNQKIVLSIKHSSDYIFWQMKVKQMLKYVGYPKNGILLGPLQTFMCFLIQECMKSFITLDVCVTCCYV